MPSEYNSSAHYYTAKESRSECVETVNDHYAEVSLNSEEEVQEAMRDARITDVLSNFGATNQTTT